MNGFPKYGDIENLYRSTDVLNHSVVITEKLHGTNVRVMWSSKDGLILGGRNEILFKDGQSSQNDGFKFGNFMQVHPAVSFLRENRKYDDHVFFGEFHGSNIQKGVKYCEDKDFRVFDIVNPEGNYLDWKDVERICEEVGFKVVPVLFIGMVTLEDLNKMIDTESITAIINGIKAENNIAEGIVIKPEKATLDKHGNPMRAKYKSQKWAENAKAGKVKKAPSAEKLELQKEAREFAENVVTLGRVATVAEHITRNGNTELDVKRTAEFLREFISDVSKEHNELYEQLDKDQMGVYNKAVASLAVKFWQDYLINNKA